MNGRPFTWFIYIKYVINMKSFIIVKKEKLDIISRYRHYESLYDGNIESDPHFEVPHEFNINTVAIKIHENKHIFFEDISIASQIREGKLQDLRIKRNLLLQKSDWTRLDDVILTEKQRNDWKEYRQKLRDLPLNQDLDNIIWPVMPL
jgi:hypothetical protein